MREKRTTRTRNSLSNKYNLYAFTALLAGMLLMSAGKACAGNLINFTSPLPAASTSNGTIVVTIHLRVMAEPTSLRVVANGKDITSQFNSATCVAAPCDISANLNGNITGAGWNYLYASIHGPSASVDSAHVRFYDKQGVADPTDGSAAPYAVHVAATYNSGIEVDYSPASGNGPFYYPGATYASQACGYGQLTMITLNRSTLGFEAINCYGPTQNSDIATYFATLTKNDLVIASGNWTRPLGVINMSSIGGTDFTAKNALVAYSYSIIGYGQSGSHVASESYKTSSTGNWDGLSGALVNIGSTTPTYAFRPTDSPAFAIQPGNANSTITFGYIQNFPIGTSAPNRSVPSSFTASTLTSPACASTCSGAIWVLVYDGYSLANVSSNTYGTNSGNSVSEMQRLSTDLTNLSPQSIALISTVGTPFTATAPPSSLLSTTIGSLGVSPYAFNSLFNGGSMALVGMPNSGPTKIANIAAGEITPITKWYSSTAEGDSGSLRGILSRNQNYLLQPHNVGPLSVASSMSNPTADDLLAFASSYQIGTANPTQWPMVDTPGHINAYKYASDELESVDYYGDAACGLQPAGLCFDIRFRYTSDEMNAFVIGRDPTTLPYPTVSQQGSATFTETEWTDVTSQLELERQYLGNSENYQTLLSDLNTNASINLGSALQSSATNVSSSLNQILGTPAKESSLNLTSDVLNSAAGISSIVGVVCPPFGIISGVLWSASAILQTFNDLSPTPDPYVNQLGDLLAANGGAASAYATNFNLQMQSGTGIFFNGVYADWFKLQTVGLMAVTPLSGWNLGDAGNASGAYGQPFILNARTSFYEQTVAQYLEEIRVVNYPNTYVLHSSGESQGKIDADVADYVAGYPSSLLAKNYSWDSRVSLGQPSCIDYVYMVLSSTVHGSVKVPSYYGSIETWTSAFGATLMGQVAPTNPSGFLGIPRNLYYDNSGYKTVFTGTPTPVAGQCGVNAGAVQQFVTTTKLAVDSVSLAPSGALNVYITVVSPDPAANQDMSGILTLRAGSQTIATQLLHTTGFSSTVAIPIAASQLLVGQNSLVVSYSGNAYYLPSNSTPVNVGVGTPTFTASVSASTITVSSTEGGQSSAAIILTPSFGFNSPVQLSCSGMPANAVCSFSQSTLTPTNGPVTTSILFTTGTPRKIGMIRAIGGAGLVACCLFGFGLPKRRRRVAVALCALVVCCLWTTGCGGNGYTTPSGASTVTITAIGGGVTTINTIELLVK
jgi:hypothetical protein